MNRNAVDLFIFAAGAAIGSVVTWKLAKTKYKHIADEEIQSVKDVFWKKLDEIQPGASTFDIAASAKETVDNREVSEYHDIISEHYRFEDFEIEKGEGGYENMQNEPYVIAPEEFGECEGYKTVSLSYYLDHILTDEDDEPIEDIEYHIGYDALTHFGDYEDDSVFVRNDLLATDYEILLIPRQYYDTPYDMSDDN